MSSNVRLFGVRARVYVVDPADDYLFGPRGGIVLRVEVEQPDVIAVGAFLAGRLGEMCFELREQVAECFDVVVGNVRCFPVASVHL
jgi:hypothetical protein